MTPSLQSSQRTILMADDDEDDRDLAQDAFRAAGLTGHLRFVLDGQELVDDLRGHAGAPAPERPDIILLDLNMPHPHLVDVMRDLAKYWFDVVELPE